MFSFLAGLYIGGFIVDFTTGVFMGEDAKSAATGSALWPVSVIKLAVKSSRN